MPNGRLHKDFKKKRRSSIALLIFMVFLIASFLIIIGLYYIPVMMRINCLHASPRAIEDGQEYCETLNKSLVDIVWNGSYCVWVCG